MTTSTSLWRDRSFVRFWSAQTSSQIGAQLGGFAIPVLAVETLRAGEFEVGALQAAGTAAFLLVGLPAGAWVDRWLKRRVMIVADLVRTVAIGMIPVLALLGVLELWHLYVIAGLIGIATVFFDVSYQSFVPLLVADDQVGGANSRLETSSQVARIGAPAVGGALLTVVSAASVLFVNAIGYLVSLGFLLGIRDSETRTTPERPPNLAREIKEGLVFVWSNRLLRTITATTAVSNIFGTIALTLVPLLILRDLDLGPFIFGLIITIGSVGGLIGAAVATRLATRIGEGTIIPVSAILAGVALVPLPFALVVDDEIVSIVLLIVVEFLFAFMVLVYNIAQLTFRQRICPPHLLGRMNASIRFVVWGGMPLAALAAGVLGTAIGILPTLWIGALGSIAAGLIPLFSPLRGMRELPRRPESPVA